MNRYCLQRCWRIRQPTPAQLHLGLQATLPHTHSSCHKAIGQTESKPVQATVTSRAWSSTAVISEQASARRL